MPASVQTEPYINSYLDRQGSNALRFFDIREPLEQPGSLTGSRQALLMAINSAQLAQLEDYDMPCLSNLAGQ